ncbi:MAG: restriction endonuclease subunit S, partial [Gemmatimonadota bacterium]|nr:restriction endonuclease subunit S [Gemmatimonadota bacterium]
MSSVYKKIGHVAKVKGGKRLPKGMSVLDKATEHPYLRVVDFGDHGINRSDIKYIDAQTFDYIKRYTIDSSDIYISIAGTIGRVGVVPKDLSGANLTENAAKITDISEDVDHRYLMYYLRSPIGQGAIRNRTGGTSQPKLALYKIADIDFLYRPLSM